MCVFACVPVCVLQRGSLPYQKMTIPEHSPPGTMVGNVTRAVDADEGSNAVVYYFIAGDAASYRPRNCLILFDDFFWMVCLRLVQIIVFRYK